MKYLPNILTIARLLSCPLIIALFILENEVKIVLIVFTAACLTDFFDGYLARKGNFRSDFGKILDPIADKVLIITMCGLLSVYGDFHPYNKIGFYIIILRELIVSFLRFNLSVKDENIDVSLLLKYKTFIQMLSFGFYLLYESIGFLNSTVFYNVVICLIWIGVYITCITGFQHFRTYLKLKKWHN